MSDLHRLLDVQAHDTTADQLHHRRATLPERDEVASLTAAIAALDAELAATAIRRDELARSQRRLEDDLAAVEAKATSVDRTLYSGTVRGPRELMDLQEELAALGRRRSHLEDEVLEILEEREPVDAALAAGEARRADLEQRLAAVGAALAEAEATIEAELAAEADRRAAAAASLPDALLAEYDRLRSRLGGVAAAPLQGRSCGGCHLTLSAVELDRLRREPPDTIVHCEECGRILVR